jgi:hypothetical protein
MRRVVTATSLGCHSFVFANDRARASEIGIDEFSGGPIARAQIQNDSAQRPVGHQKGGVYHDGRFAPLRDVVDHYDKFF